MTAGVTGNHREVRTEQGFNAYVLRNDRLEIVVVPALGAKIISLKNLRSGRQWMWHPEAGLKLFTNRLGDDFSRSPLVGADECLPTIAPCSFQGRELPDHGEVWSAAWEVDRQALEGGVLKTSVDLPVSPFTFERRIELRSGHILFGYVLRSRSSVAESYLWALHPLLRVQPGDRLEIPATTLAPRNGEEWIDVVDSLIPAGRCAKVFAGPLKQGVAAVYNRESGDRLALEWNPVENDTLGLWLTRGGWYGHHHLALEPTNGAPDQLAAAVEGKRCGIVPAAGSRAWGLTMRLEP